MIGFPASESCVKRSAVATAGYLSEVFVSYQGEGAYVGRRHLFIRLAGCNLRCSYCDTPYALDAPEKFRLYERGEVVQERPNPVSCEELLSDLLPLARRAAPIDAVALTGGEPLLQAEFLANLLSDERLPRPRLLETNGTLPGPLGVLLPWLDVVSMDMKLPSNTGEPHFWATHARFLRTAGEKAYVKVLVNEATDPGDVARAADLVRVTRPASAFFLQPATGGDGRIALESAALDSFFDAAKQCLDDVRVLPQMHRLFGKQIK